MGRARTLAFVALAAVGCANAAAQGRDYVIGPRDVLGVTLWTQMDLSGKYTVDADGTVTFPLVGTVKVDGLTVAQAAAVLREKLTQGFFRDPQLSVSIDDYRSQHLFVMGQVRQPGSYPLSGDMTVLEALARAGSTTADAAPEALIVRAIPGSAPSRAVLPAEASPAAIIRVNVNDLQSGAVASTISLHDGDTIFVPRAETIFVSGQVRNPGAYAIGRSTTVLQAITLAGGPTEHGATTRIRIIRIVDGRKQDVKAKLDDVVKPGDTVIVPERFF
jgi:polysaccharide export outer membrane protein